MSMSHSSSKSFADMLNFSRKPQKLRITVYVSAVDAEDKVGISLDSPTAARAAMSSQEMMQNERSEEDRGLEDEPLTYTFEPNTSTDEFAKELKAKIENYRTACNQSLVNTNGILLDVQLTADSSWAQSTKGTAWEHLAPVWSTIQGSGVEGVRYLDLSESKLAIMAWAPQLARLSRSLTVLDVSGLGLMNFPPELLCLKSLQSLHAQKNKLTKLPDNIGNLIKLRLLQIDHNQLESIPQSGLRGLTELEHLSMECNKLSHLLINFSDVPKLRSLLLAGNPLKYLPDFTRLRNLSCFTVANVRIESRGDPGKSLDLNHISIGLGEGHSSAESSSKPSFILAPFSRAASPRSRWSSFIEVIFRTPACQHPLIAAAIVWVAKERSYAEAISNDKNALQQLQGMILAEDGFVVRCATSTLASLASANSRVAYGFIDDSGRHTICRLLKANSPTEQLSGLHLLAALALTSEEIALPLAYPPILCCLVSLIEDANDSAVQRHALLALGNLSFYNSIRRSMLNNSVIRNLAIKVARRRTSQHKGGSSLQEPGALLASDPVRLAAIRLLGILGLNDDLASSLREDYPANPTEPSKSGHGVRILCLDGGGMRGFLTVKLLMELERRLGRPLHECFDLIVGTSTGGILAATIGIKRQSLDFALNLYRKLGKKIFELRPSNDTGNDGDKSSDEDNCDDSQADQAHPSSVPAKPRSSKSYWQPTGIDINALYGKSSLRIFLRGSKYDSSRFEEMIMSMSETANGPQTEALNQHARNEGQWDSDYDRLIDHCVLGTPKTAIVATRVSVTPVQPYLFRTYQCPPEIPEPSEVESSPGDECRPTSLCFPYPGSNRNALWEAVRASSAAPYYFEEFQVGEDRWADGAVVANNPSLIALREARVIWPDVPVSVLVSVGSGSFPFKPREKSGHWFIDMGTELMESATNFHLIGGALETLMPLIPGLQYFRFCPSDKRCDVELDDTSEEAMEALNATVTEYIEANKEHFAAAVDILLASCDQKEHSTVREHPSISRESEDNLFPPMSSKAQPPSTTAAQSQLPVRVVIVESHPTIKTLMEKFQEGVLNSDLASIKDRDSDSTNNLQRSINRNRSERRIDVYKVSAGKKLDYAGGNYEMLHLALDWSPEGFVTSFQLPADDVAIVEGSDEWVDLVGDQQEIRNEAVLWGKEHAFVSLACMRHQGIGKDIAVRICKRIASVDPRLRDGNVNSVLLHLGLAHCKFEVVTLSAAISRDLAEQLLDALGSRAVVYPENVGNTIDQSEEVKLAIGEQLSSLCQQIHVEKRSIESVLQKLSTKDNIITWKAVQASRS